MKLNKIKWLLVIFIAVIPGLLGFVILLLIDPWFLLGIVLIIFSMLLVYGAIKTQYD